ncbi:hypothetical protein GF324_05045 [bacterium]|nr:hypothetical protein [bacterium]
MVEAIRVVQRGRRVFSGTVDPAVDDPTADPIAVLRRKLTPMENRVLDLHMEGKRNIEIARIIDKSPKTVHSHLRSLYEKLNVDSLPALLKLLGQ